MKTHWKKLDNHDYLGAYSLLGTETEELTTTIKKVVIEEVKSAQNPNGDDCKVAHLEGCKPMILNATNSRMIESIYKTPFIEDWEGKAITIYVAKINVKGEQTDGLRIRKVKPVLKLAVLKLKTETYKKVVEAMRNGYTLDQIRGKYDISEVVEINLKKELK